MEPAHLLGNHFEDWLLFQNIVARNYLHHREIIKGLAHWSVTNSKDGMRILDLGCGDCHVAQKAFKKLGEVDYSGIDHSDHALNIARANFHPDQWGVRLLEGDVTKVIQKLNGPFDLIIVGYSFQYLPLERQATALDQIRLILNPSGTLIVYDLMPRQNESMHAFSNRLIDDAVSQWDHLEPDQIEAFSQHIRQSARLMSQQQWQMKAMASALGKAELIYRDDAEHIGMLKFGR